MCKDKEIITMEQKDVKKSWYSLAGKSKKKKKTMNKLYIHEKCSGIFQKKYNLFQYVL